jgi:hypothetical protein
MSMPSAARLAAASFLLLAPFLGSCSEKPPMGLRSGTPDDDYVEQPLSDEAKGFEQALNLSNRALELIKAGDAKGVYEQLLDPRLQAKATAEQFAAPIEGNLKTLGPIKQYKPQQWGFAQVQDGPLNAIYCTKLVEHERAIWRYHFKFANDGKFEKLIGISAFPRKAVGPPGPP